jgi:outer membrane biosynthesis protein TonB
MKVGLTISAAAHLALFAWGLVSLSPKPFAAADSIPVDVISASEFSQIMAGAKTAPKADAPKPLVDKIAEPEPVKDTTPKVADKPDIVTASTQPAAPPEPKPESKPPEQKAEPKPEKKPEPQVDPIAETLKKEEAKKKEDAKKLAETKKREEAKKKEEAKKRDDQKFDPNQIAALLDKRSPQRQAATGAALNHTPSLGAPNASAQTLSQNEIDALRAQIQACWNPPAGVADAKELIVTVRLMLKQDGSLSADPVVLNRGGNPLFQIAAESATRAVRRCQPYRLPVAKYEVWKDVEVNFDPRDMFRG